MKRVLIVEDDEDTRKIYETALKESGYQVLSATHGAEGVHLARQHSPDIILMDIRMPVMNGYEAMRYLKAYRETSRIPVCGISAYKPDEDEANLTAIHGFDCFFSKPLDPRQIVALIQERIGPANGNGGGTVRDPGSREERA